MAFGFMLLMSIVLTVLVLVGIAAVPAFMYMRTQNRLAALDARCDTAFSDIDVHLKHRHSLLPGLVSTVREYVKYEDGLITKVLDARNDALAAVAPNMKLHSENNLKQTINSLMNVADRYPELKASPHFNAMREELTDVENRITAARRFYNLTIEEYNATLRQFPGSYVASKKGLNKRQPFDLGIDRLVMDEPVSIAL